MIEWIFFALIALVAVAAAVGVVAQRNVIYSGLLLVGNFLCLAALYILMNAQFVGVVQIIVYAGALMVLFLFAVMLLAGQRTSLGDSGLAGQRSAAVLLALVLGAELALLITRGSLAAAQAGTPLDVALGGNVQAVAQVLFTRYLWAFEATGLLLLVAVVGVVYLIKGRPGAGAER